MSNSKYIAFISNGEELSVSAIKEIEALETHDQVIQANECSCTQKEHLLNCEIVNVEVKVETNLKIEKKYVVEMAFCKECGAYYIPQSSFKFLSDQGRITHHIKGGIKLFEYMSHGESYNEEAIQLSKIEEKIQEQYDSLPKVVSRYAIDDGCGGCMDLQSQKNSAKDIYEKQDELNALMRNPYYGRIDVSDSSNTKHTYYIGGANDKFIGDFRVYSAWSDQGRLFARTNEPTGSINGSQNNVNLRRKIDILECELRGVEDVFSSNSEFADKGIYDKFLIQVLMSRKKSHQLTDIIATIQDKQNEIVEKAYIANLIVQGCAGSGKTMVMLHRLSFWLYNNKSLSTERIKILTPNENFNIHIGGLHSQLSLGDIEILSVAQYYNKLLEQYDKVLVVNEKVNEEENVEEKFLNYIYSKAFIKGLKANFNSVIEDYCLRDEYDFIDLCASKVDYKFSRNSGGSFGERIIEFGKAIRLISSRVSTSYSEMDRYKKKIKNNIETQEKCRISIENEEKSIEEMKGNFRGQIIININEILFSIDESLNQKRKQETQINANIEKIDRGFKKLFKRPDLKNEQEKLEKIQNLIESEEQDKVIWQKIKDEVQAVETIEEAIRIIDGRKIRKEGNAIAQYLGSYKRHKHNLFEQRLIIDKLEQEIIVNKELIEKSNMSFTEDEFDRLIAMSDKYSQRVPLLLFEKIFDKTVQEKLVELNLSKTDKVYRYVLFARLQFAMLLWEKTVGKDELICIDEGQDVSFSEYELIIEQNKKNHAHYNVYGDLNQRIKQGRGLRTWEQLKRKLLANIYELNENYRNTNQITQYCNDAFNFDMTLTGVEGEVVRNITFAEMMNELAKLDTDGSRVAVILPRSWSKQRITRGKAVEGIKERISVKFDPNKISVMYVDEIKGIEFDQVFVVDEDMERNERYIAYTRALGTLSIVH